MGCFIMLFAIHVAEAATWGLGIRGARDSFRVATEGVYFAGVTITALA